jgi:hypothetical protein
MSIFSSEDYNSNDGMLTYVWGPAMWHYLHTMSFNYPVNPTSLQKKQYKDFILSLQHTLPCGACRKNLKKNLEKCKLTPYVMKNRNTFSRWMYRLHEEVNKMLGKKSGLSYEQVRDRYENFRARCSYDSPRRESGCVEPVVGKKSKCIISIVPKDVRCETFNMHRECYSQKNY